MPSTSSVEAATTIAKHQRERRFINQRMLRFLVAAVLLLFALTCCRVHVDRRHNLPNQPPWLTDISEGQQKIMSPSTLPSELSHFMQRPESKISDREWRVQLFQEKRRAASRIQQAGQSSAESLGPYHLGLQEGNREGDERQASIQNSQEEHFRTRVTKDKVITKLFSHAERGRDEWSRITPSKYEDDLENFQRMSKKSRHLSRHTNQRRDFSFPLRRRRTSNGGNQTFVHSSGKGSFFGGNHAYPGGSSGNFHGFAGNVSGGSQGQPPTQGAPPKYGNCDDDAHNGAGPCSGYVSSSGSSSSGTETAIPAPPPGFSPPAPSPSRFSTPTATPVATPPSTPVAAPVTPPFTPPNATPVAAPVPVAAPFSPPVSPPISPPATPVSQPFPVPVAASPLSTPEPVAPPVPTRPFEPARPGSAPFSLPTPVALPVPEPVAPPLSFPAAPPTPVTAPFQAPVSPPATPVAIPVFTPVASPVVGASPQPVSPPVPTPAAPPTPAPVIGPFQAPVSPPATPVAIPVFTPVTAPVTAPIPEPVALPVSPPVPTPAAPPTPAPVTGPFQAPVSPPATPVAIPVSAPFTAPIAGAAPRPFSPPAPSTSSPPSNSSVLFSPAPIQEAATPSPSMAVTASRPITNPQPAPSLSRAPSYENGSFSPAPIQEAGTPLPSTTTQVFSPTIIITSSPTNALHVRPATSATQPRPLLKSEKPSIDPSSAQHTRFPSNLVLNTIHLDVNVLQSSVVPHNASKHVAGVMSNVLNADTPFHAYPANYTFSGPMMQVISYSSIFLVQDPNASEVTVLSTLNSTTSWRMYDVGYQCFDYPSNMPIQNETLLQHIQSICLKAVDASITSGSFLHQLAAVANQSHVEVLNVEIPGSEPTSNATSSQASSPRTYQLPLSTKGMDLRRWIGIAIALATVGGSALLMHLGAQREKKLKQEELWGFPLATEQDVGKFLNLGFMWQQGEGHEGPPKGVIVFNKERVGYRDDDSILMGGFQDSLWLMNAAEVTLPSSGTSRDQS